MFTPKEHDKTEGLFHFIRISLAKRALVRACLNLKQVKIQRLNISYIRSLVKEHVRYEYKQPKFKTYLI